MQKSSLTTDTGQSSAQFGDAVSETFHDTNVAARKTAKGLGVLAEAIAADTKDGVHKISEAVKGESSHVLRVLGESVRDRPSLTLGIAAGLGILIGLIVSGRR
jgi:ElaB/YqjD/DUF883 family membrane-anchored ribosome-binding protein